VSDSVAFLRDVEPEYAELAVWLRERVLAADPDLTERIYRGWQGVGFHHPEAGYVCAIYPRSTGVVLLFEHGAGLPDPEHVLQGEGKQTRFIRVEGRDDALARTIELYVQQAIGQRLFEV
jgi:hypothetical protein